MPGTRVPIKVGGAARRASLLVAAIVLTISISGCGGSQERLTSKALAAKADAICEQLRYELNAADKQSGQGITVPDRAKLSVLYAAAEEHAANQLAKLKPEAPAEQEWQQIIAKRRALIPYHHEMTKYASRGEVGKLEATYTAYKAAQRQMQLAFKYSRFGFKICWDIG
jgi:hypothetical protein